MTNGPYQLKSWSGESATLEVFRDLSYPLGVGSFDTYAIPRRGYITKVEREDRGLRLSADIEIVMKFMRDYRIVRQPLTAVDPILVKRAAPECRYVVIDSESRVALAGAQLQGNLPPKIVAARSTQRGRKVRGKVVDRFLDAVLGAQVSLEKSSGGGWTKVATGKTNERGFYSLRAKRRGTYRVTVRMAGVTATSRTIHAGR